MQQLILRHVVGDGVAKVVISGRYVNSLAEAVEEPVKGEEVSQGCHTLASQMCLIN